MAGVSPVARAHREVTSAASQEWILDAQCLKTQLDDTPVKLRTYALANHHPTIPGPLLQTRPGEV